MKKLALLSVAFTVLPSLVFAAGNHPMSGCGLGYLLLANKDNDKVTQVLGATTNGTFGSQTFGISSGTSGCTQDGAVKIARSTEVFAEVNFASLRKDIAAGQGEYVEAFSTLLGASDANRLIVAQFMKQNYSTLFPTSSTNSDEMLATLSGLLSQKPELLS